MTKLRESINALKEVRQSRMRATMPLNTLKMTPRTAKSKDVIPADVTKRKNYKADTRFVGANKKKKRRARTDTKVLDM